MYFSCHEAVTILYIMQNSFPPENKVLSLSVTTQSVSLHYLSMVRFNLAVDSTPPAAFSFCLKFWLQDA